MSESWAMARRSLWRTVWERWHGPIDVQDVEARREAWMAVGELAERLQALTEQETTETTLYQLSREAELHSHNETDDHPRRRKSDV